MPGTPPHFHTSQPDSQSAIDRDSQVFPAAQPSDEDKYFSSSPVPDYLPQLKLEVDEFVRFHQRESHKKVVLVTLGGTTVPLENNTVRFIDNFSAGTRGATSAEYFLQHDYAVIFLHREFSLLPYSRHYSHTTNCFLDYMVEHDNKAHISPAFADDMLAVLRQYTRAKSSNSLLLLPFTTVNQYLYTLKLVAECMQQLLSNALFYLAAAVSDFFLPSQHMPHHKIQLRDTNGSPGKLVVQLEPVPKFLSRLVDQWAPRAMIVSFKLETDENLLLSKAQSALERYQHQLVIGNLLQTRKRQVVFVWPRGEPEYIQLSPADVAVEIESLIVPKVIAAHAEWLCHK